MYKIGQRVTTEYGAGTVRESSARRVFIILDSGDPLNVATGTHGYDRITPLTYAERQEMVIGYVDNGGRVRCTSCVSDGVPMLAHMLASPADRCENCERQLVTA